MTLQLHRFGFSCGRQSGKLCGVGGFLRSWEVFKWLRFREDFMVEVEAAHSCSKVLELMMHATVM